MITNVNAIYQTVDGGDSWLVQKTLHYPYQSYLKSMEAYGDHIWICGTNGVAVHSNDGGNQWVVQPYKLDDYNFHNLVITDQDHCLMVGENGTIVYTDQMGYLAPFILSEPNDTIVCEGSYLKIEPDAIGDSLQYQWYRAGYKIPGENDPSLVFDSIQITDGYVYSYIISNGAGIVHSDVFQINIKPRLKILAGPEDVTTYQNDTVILNQAVTGALPIHYQWQKDGIDIPGAIFHTYAIYGVQPADSGLYRCVVSNDCNQEITDEATLTVIPVSATNEIGMSSMEVFPNPAKDKIYFESPSQDQFEYVVYDIQGMEKLIGMLIPSVENSISIGHLPPGIYFIHLKNQKNGYHSRFIKQ